MSDIQKQHAGILEQVKAMKIMATEAGNLNAMIKLLEMEMKLTGVDRYEVLIEQQKKDEAGAKKRLQAKIDALVGDRAMQDRVLMKIEDLTDEQRAKMFPSKKEVLVE